MPDGRSYIIHEIYRHLSLALIGIGDKQREHILKAVELLEKHEVDFKKSLENETNLNR